MGLFGKSKKEREKEYMNRLDVPLCLKEDFELIIDDVFTIMGVGTVATGNISTGMCREGENACVYKTNGGVLETIITTIDIHTKERKSNGCGYKTEHISIENPDADFATVASLLGTTPKQVAADFVESQSPQTISRWNRSAHRYKYGLQLLVGIIVVVLFSVVIFFTTTKGVMI